jgi:hypothetical protein
MNLEFFIFKDGKLELAEETIFLYPEFKRLITRDRGSVGDADGRKKFRAFKELAYVWMIASAKSYPNLHGLNDEEKHDHAIKALELEPKYKPDEEVLKAIRKYRELTTSTIKELTHELNISINTVKNLVKILRKNLDKKIENPNVTPKELEEALITSGKITDVIGNIPGYIAHLKEYDILINKEEKGDSDLGRGNVEIEESQEPNRSI